MTEVKQYVQSIIKKYSGTPGGVIDVSPDRFHEYVGDAMTLATECRRLKDGLDEHVRVRNGVCDALKGYSKECAPFADSIMRLRAELRMLKRSGLDADPTHPCCQSIKPVDEKTRELLVQLIKEREANKVVQRTAMSIITDMTGIVELLINSKNSTAEKK